MSDATRRIARWNTKYNLDRVKAILEEQRPEMYARVQARFTELVLMEAQVKQVLDSKGVSVMQYPAYLCFGRELWHMIYVRQYSGPSAAKEAATLVAKWKDRGLSQAVLEAVRSEVFNIGPPTP